ncbi:MAG: phosphopantetheine-binding protein [Cypionkella sp.]|jgi:acyl carrier protein|nr:phosphopantetheine-binding protein [Cypionkella sp.]
MTEIAETVRAIVAEKAMVDLAEVSGDLPLAALGMDSLAVVETIFAIEEAFDIQIPVQGGDVGSVDLSTVGAMIRAVEGLVAQKAA